MITELTKSPVEDLQIKKVSGPPESPTEHAEAEESFLKALQDPDNKIRTLCIGCSSDVSLMETALCECGGFVCKNCQVIEDEGVCDHEIPAEILALRHREEEE